MVTMFDMVTGELIAGEDRQDVVAPAAAGVRGADRAMLAPRLEPVVEATCRALLQQLPADLATASVTAFLARQQR